VPDLLPTRAGVENVRIGVMHHVDEVKGYGYLTVREGLHVNDVRTDVFLHINDFADRGRLADMEPSRV
jgi:cold shock CspA family protein